MTINKRTLLGILGLSALGFITALWLLTIHLKFSTGQAGLTEGCSSLPLMGSSQGCATVAVSDFSKPLGIPLPAIAMGFYFSLFVLVFWAWRSAQAFYEPLYFAYFLSGLGVLVTALMVFIARTQLQSFCLGCTVLWIINLSLWPLFAKTLRLSWGAAPGAMAEIFVARKMNLKRSRVTTAATVSGISLAIFCAIGLSASTQQMGSSMYGDKNRAIQDYEQGSVIFLSEEMLKGPQVKQTKGGAAPIMDIVEFSDFQCPACKMAAQYFRPFLLKHGNKVRFSYRHFPLDGSCNSYTPNGMHLHACAAARAAICAGDQGKFFEYHDQVFDQQDSISSDFLVSVADKLGVDMNKFNACLGSPDTASRLQRDISWGDSVKVEFTPTIIINGRKMGGAMAPAQLEALLEHLQKK